MARRPAPTELLAWTLVGATLGLAAGYLLAEVVGPLRAGTDRSSRGPGQRPVTGATLVRLASRALEGDPLLRELGLQFIPSMPGVVELHGWVPSRSLRARAARLVAAEPGIADVVNCLLVRGEDDLAPADFDRPTPRT
jgi:hypothetical protein